MREHVGERVPILSLGAGVQSTVLALMAKRGDFGVVPRYAVFADTQREPRGVYDHLNWLSRELSPEIEVIRVTAGDLGKEAEEADYNPVPLFKKMVCPRCNGTGVTTLIDTDKPDGPHGEPRRCPRCSGEGEAVSIGRRQCTYQFKLRPIRRWARENGKVPAEFWVGISLDEVVRMKPTGLQWATNVWPLIEHRITRRDCEAWYAKHYPERPKLDKSACYFCPYHSKAIWRDMRDNDPVSWGEAIRFDRKMNERGEYVHASAVPLDEVDLTTPEDHGQLNMDAECEGMCGV